jgi:hypothetical protein
VADVFLSYSRHDRRSAKELVHALESLGISVWWDRRLWPGRPVSTTIQGELESARCVVVLWSRSSIESTYVLDEAERGRKAGKLIPALVEDVEIPLGLGGIHAARLHRAADEPEELETFFAAILARLQRPGAETYPPFALPGRRRWAVLAVSIAVLSMLPLAYRWVVPSPPFVFRVSEENLGKGYELEFAGDQIPARARIKWVGAAVTAETGFPTLELDVTNRTDKDISVNAVRLVLTELVEQDSAVLLAVVYRNESETLREEIEARFGLEHVALDPPYHLYVRRDGVDELEDLASALAELPSVSEAFVDAAGQAHAEWKTVVPVDFLLKGKDHVHERPVREQIAAASSLTVPIVFGCERDLSAVGQLFLVYDGVESVEALEIELELRAALAFGPKHKAE